MYKFLIFIIYFVISLSSSRGQTNCIRVYLHDSNTGKTIVGAHVLDVKKQLVVTSDSLGYFELCDHVDSCIIQITHLTYTPIEIKLKPDNKPIEIKLTGKTYEFEEIVVGLDKEETSILPGVKKISQQEILSMPTLMGETDVVRSLQQLAGVQSVSEGVNGIMVRGGSAGHNLVMLDNMELMNPVHLMGIYSVFNPLTTSSAEVYTGNSPVYVRGKIASSILVNSINPQNGTSYFQGSIGNITTNLMTVQHSSDKKFSIILGVRRSYLDVIREATSLFVRDENNYFKNYFYSFYDFNGKAIWQIRPKTSISAGWYLGADNFTIQDEKAEYDARTNYGNKCFSIELKTLIKPDLSFSASINHTFAWSEFSGDLLDNQVSFESALQQLSFKTMLLYQKNKHIIRFGIDAYRYLTMPQKLDAYVLEDSLTQRNLFVNNDFSLYIEDTYSLSERVDLYWGLRYYYYLNYNEIYKKRLWIDSGSPISSYMPIVPTFSISHKTESQRLYKLAYAYNVQMGHLSSISSIPLPNDVWVMSSDKLKPERAHQLSLAYHQKVPFGKVKTEIFGKAMQNQLIFNVNTDKNVQMEFDEHFIKGKGKAYGLEISIDKTNGILTGMLNYTLSRSKRSFDEIYGGKWFNDKFDRIHDLSMVANYRLNNRWEFSANWVFASGNCLTLPAGRYWAIGMIMSDYDGFNTFRLPPYHRLDLSANLTLKSNRFRESILNFSIINVYNRSNPYFVFYKVYQGNSRYDIQIKASQISLFPIMPSINWRFKF